MQSGSSKHLLAGLVLPRISRPLNINTGDTPASPRPKEGQTPQLRSVLDAVMLGSRIPPIDLCPADPNHTECEFLALPSKAEVCRPSVPAVPAAGAARLPGEGENPAQTPCGGGCGAPPGQAFLASVLGQASGTFLWVGSSRGSAGLSASPLLHPAGRATDRAWKAAAAAESAGAPAAPVSPGGQLTTFLRMTSSAAPFEQPQDAAMRADAQEGPGLFLPVEADDAQEWNAAAQAELSRCLWESFVWGATEAGGMLQALLVQVDRAMKRCSSGSAMFTRCAVHSASRYAQGERSKRG